MTPHFQLKEEQQHPQLFLSLPQQAASSPSADHLTFFNATTTITTTQDQRFIRVAVNKPEESKPFDQKVKKYMTHDGGSSHQQASSSSPLQSAAVDIHCAANGHNLPLSRKEYGDYESASDNNGSPAKWMSSKIRLMKKMTNSDIYSSPPSSADNKPLNKFQYPIPDTHETHCLSKSDNVIRVCSDCNTTTTPLWRSGPRGPKSLCNACGIRQRKARRALEAAAAVAANGAAVATDATSVKIKVHKNKEKKPRTIHVARYKKQFKSTSDNNSRHHQSQKKLCFKEFAISFSKNSALQRVFPQDVEDAAILLMELSCGLVHS